MDNYVPRPEFELLCKSMNGSLVRIESTLRDVNTKLDGLAEADNQRVTKEEYHADMDTLKGRPSWSVALIVGFLSTGLATTLTLILTGVIK